MVKVKEVKDPKGISLIAYYPSRKEKALSLALKETQHNRCKTPGCRARREPSKDLCRDCRRKHR
jgi:hypothetical protein